MNDQEVITQINQMVQFIHQEAKEKANEIKLKTDEEFNIEKLRMVEAEKQKIRAAYEVKEKQVEVQKRIAQSNEVRFSRLKALKARDDAMQQVLAEAASKLPALVASSEYPALLEALILEALCQLADQKVSVKGVAGQESQTKAALTKATAKFTKWATDNKGADWAASIDIKFDSASLKSGIGGIEVTGFGGKITLSNSLQSRLMLAYETQLPKLRSKLFG
mmetsp:Transcript_44805/g.117526  ORF Transcript_44805/g.117526 Transcript_44805/m.117526 type:complete len:221 (-) Transcript_44805:460-1122(-)|eukprot:CAMPEP_0115857902 /NCGR_PEP_ID=MMETSP0287-20121206/15816_1 /TAXON_ID=412157 /ORGANISM="Chrysochromulina rotalis, Strain UIO044" /LENGTH=220 /DNA_ID=CAMNT_0003312139 /DNA_START=24 /DNA_END=686 /DNA_ORIENTATION=+